MTQELIPLTISAIGNEEQKTVNARDLHAFLEVKTRFNDWIERRIADFGFVESVDFVSVTQKRVTGGTQTDYFLSLSMAKEIAMVERNAKGKQARLYFIECEKIAKAKALPTQFQIPQTMQEALRLAADQNGQERRASETDRSGRAKSLGLRRSRRRHGAFHRHRRRENSAYETLRPVYLVKAQSGCLSARERLASLFHVGKETMGRCEDQRVGQQENR